MRGLEEKVVIVTGGCSGIGLGIVQRFSEEGCHVVVADTDEENGKNIEKQMKNVSFLTTDVSDPEDVERVVDFTKGKHDRLNIIVNNAGIVGEQQPLVESSLENWQRVLRINLDGIFYGMKYGMRAMLSNRDGGAVINMGSVCSFVGYKNISPYIASKGAILQLTKSAALEYAEAKIRVNTVCPSAVMTPLIASYLDTAPDPVNARKEFESMNPMPGAPTVEDVAAATAFLASDDARFLTGVALPVDGGFIVQ